MRCVVGARKLLSEIDILIRRTDRRCARGKVQNRLLRKLRSENCRPCVSIRSGFPLSNPTALLFSLFED